MGVAGIVLIKNELNSTFQAMAGYANMRVVLQGGGVWCVQKCDRILEPNCLGDIKINREKSY